MSDYGYGQSSSEEMFGMDGGEWLTGTGSSQNQAMNQFTVLASIPEAKFGHFSPNQFPQSEMGSPGSFGSFASSGRRSCTTHSSSSMVMSPSFEKPQLSFDSTRPSTSAPHRSLLTAMLKAQAQSSTVDFTPSQQQSANAMAPPPSPMYTSSPSTSVSPSQLSPWYNSLPVRGLNFDRDQQVSQALDHLFNPMSDSSPLGSDWFNQSLVPMPMSPDISSPNSNSDFFMNGGSSGTSTSLQVQPVAIRDNRRINRHSTSGGSLKQVPYTRSTSVTSDICSPIMCGSMPVPGPFTTTPTMGAGFSPEQLAAAQAILQFIAEHPTSSIPAALITNQLVEISSGRGYCLIGNCGLERAMQKRNPAYDASKDMATRKRVDHLYDHIRDKHFDCRPFKCSQCSRAFSRDHDLKRHEAVHNPNNATPCNYCPRSYTRDDNLKRHVAQKHPEVALPALQFPHSVI